MSDLSATDEAPEIAVEQVGQSAGERPGSWLVSWRFGNLTAEAIALASAWLPHGEFRGERTELAPARIVRPRESAEIDLDVRWNGEPGSVVENAFLILIAHWKQEPWRVLVRLTIRGTPERMPHATTETMSIQRVGFSEQGEP